MTRPNRPVAATCSSCTVDARFDARGCLRGHRRAVSLTTIFDEHYPTFCDMASRADERMVLETTYSDRVLRDAGGQDQLTGAGSTTHHSHSNCTHLPSAHPIIGDA